VLTNRNVCLCTVTSADSQPLPNFTGPAMVVRVKLLLKVAELVL
jgi:hypothetical protein